MKTLFTLTTILALSVGCARFSTTQTDIRYDPETGRPATAVTTKASAYTIIKSDSSLTNWKAQQTEGEQGAEVGGLEQNTDVDIQKILEAMAALANAIKP